MNNNNNFSTAKSTYEELLQSPEWGKRREEILLRDNFQCRVCGSRNQLQVHHRQYHFLNSKGDFKKPWEYDDINLITLCGSCHERGHQIFNVPTFYI
jgi:5-methylcytosine-specific restriction endonuclease McrA